MVEPLLIDPGYAIAGTEDEVNKIRAAKYFSQPVGECEFGGVTRLRQRRQGSGTILGKNEDVEVFCRPSHAGVPGQRIAPTDQEGYLRFLQHPEDLPVK